MTHYKRIKDLREDQGLLQRQIAIYLGTSQRQYSRWETGDYPIPLEIMIKLADYYNVSLDYITGRTNDPRGIGFDGKAKYNIVQSGNRKAIVNIGDDKP